MPRLRDDRMSNALRTTHLAGEDAGHGAGDGMSLNATSIGVMLSHNAFHAARLARDAGSSGVVGTRPGIARGPGPASTRRVGHRCGPRCGWVCPTGRNRQGRGRSRGARPPPVSGSSVDTETTTTVHRAASVSGRRRLARLQPRPPEAARPHYRRFRNTLGYTGIRADPRSVRRACAMSACRRTYRLANRAMNQSTHCGAPARWTVANRELVHRQIFRLIACPRHRRTPYCWR
jgi:hypothetical protein